MLFRNYFYRPIWNIARVDENITGYLRSREARGVYWCTQASGDLFLADPFALTVDGKTVVLAEEFDYAKGRGRIVALEDEMHPQSARVAIEEPYHLSFPFLVEDGGHVYCIPESYQAREITLYRALAFPTSWIREATLVSDFAGNDSTVVRYGNKWWMFSTDYDMGFSSALCVFYADRLSGPWHAHPMNPVKVDVRSACSAGTPFQHDGSLYRPAQDCSQGYGRRIVINRVATLTETQFAEEPVAIVEPYPGRYNAGTHTLSAAGGRTYVDGLSYAFHPGGLIALAKRQAKVALQTAGVPDDVIARIRRPRT
ncbi:MAG: hypothetical protein JO194_06700 [Candidatus Eremiobacteraeota bacterium]|nr:hypothetical protein [Candidatus Eremiobacteraeota bacterium]